MKIPPLVAALTWQYLRAFPLVALLTGVLVLGAIVFYLPQSGPLQRRWKIVLPGLRLAALAVLAVSLMQPVITRSPTPAEMGTIVIVVDHSHSMGIVDQQRRPAQLVALADGLGRLPAGLRSRGDELNRAVRDVRDKFDEVSTAQSRLTFAMISGRSTLDAAAQLSAAFPKLDSAASALVARRTSLNPKSPMALALENLQKQMHRPRDAGQTEAWLLAMRTSLDATATAAEAFQANADQVLYNTNPAVRAICAELRGLSRFGLVDQAITHPATGLLSNLPSQMPVYGFAVGDEVTPLPLRAAGRPVRRLLLDTESSGADLAAGIRAALDSLGGAPVDAVVLFSDGRRAAGKAPGSSPAVGAPVFAVAVASPASSLDWSLSHVSAPDGVYAGEPFTVRARVHGVGMRIGAQVDVRCTAGEATIAPPIAVAPLNAAWAAALGAIEAALLESPPKRVTLGADLSAEVEFEMKLDEPGARRLTLRLPEVASEITSENNVVERWVKVYPRKWKVALLAAAPSWDYRAVRDALGARSGVELYTEVMGDDSCTLSADGFLQQDTVVLFDVAAESLDAHQWNAVRSLAGERGGTVALVAGSEHLPAEYHHEPMADLLPYWIETGAAQSAPDLDNKPAWRTWQGEDPVYRFGPPEDQSRGPRLAAVDLADRRAWTSLPPLYRYLQLPQLKPVARPLLVERETNEPVVTEMPLGAGRVLFVALDETWRWRHKVGPALQESLWMQLLRDRADPPCAATVGRLSLDIGKAAVAPGEAIDVRVKLLDAAGGAARTPSAELRVLRGGATVRTQTIAPSEAAPGRCAGTLMGLPAGTYTLEARVDDQVVQYPLHVVRQYEAELEDPSGDRAALERIVTASGGRLMSLEQLRELPALLTGVASDARPVTLRLWDSSYLFAFVVACFAAEWAMRKRLGLA